MEIIEVFRNRIIIEGLANKQKNIRKDLLYKLFESFPKLKSIEITKSSEYDDNNYYDNIYVGSVNDIALESEEYIVENNKVYKNWDEEVLANEDDILDNHLLEYVVEVAKESISDYDYGDYKKTREEVLSKKPAGDNVFDIYYQSYISGNRIKSEQVFCGHPHLAVCYAYDVLKGRFDAEVEALLEKDFKSSMRMSYLYAVYCIKGRLPKNVDNYFNLKSFKELDEQEKRYLNLYGEFLKSNDL